MKILTIRMRNLASLEGAVEIDFTQGPLATAGIFAITGPTGAGKSTILDALCLALYGKTPRYSLQTDSGIEVKNISQSDARGILRDGTAEGFAEVDFIGLDKQHYRATWSVRRARSKADGNLQAFNIELKNLSTQTDIPGKKSELLPEIERLVGLSFEQFTRSVLLAQGEFTAFLKAGKDDKSSLLEKLTGTQIYSAISMRIFERHKEEALRLHDLDIQRAGIPTLLPEEQVQLEEQQQTLTTTLQTLEQRITQLDLEITWYQQLLTLKQQIETASVQYRDTAVARKEAAPRVAKLQQIEQVQVLRTPIENLHNTQQQLAEKEALQDQQEKTVSQLAEAQEQHSEVVQDAEKLLAEKIEEQEMTKPMLDRAKELDVQLKGKIEQVLQAGEELKNSQTKHQQLTELRSKCQEEYNKCEKEVARLTKWKTDRAEQQIIAENESLILARLQDAASALLQEQQALQQLEQIALRTKKQQEVKDTSVQEREKIITALQNASQQYEAVHSALTAIPLDTIVQDKARVDDAIQQVVEAAAQWQLVYTTQQEMEQLSDQLQKQQRELAHHRELLAPGEEALQKILLQKDTSQQLLNRARLAAAENVETLRGSLVSSEPCMVCGSTHHPYTMENPQLQKVLTQLETDFNKLERAYEQQFRTYTGLQQTVLQLAEEARRLADAFNHKDQQTQALNKTWRSLPVNTECLEVPDKEKREWLQDRLRQQKERQQELQNRLKNVHEQQQQADTLQNEYKRLDSLQTELDNRIKDAEREMKSLQEQQQNQSREIQKCRDTQLSIQTSLGNYFTFKGWWTEWKDESVIFIKQIQASANEWKNNVRSLDELVLKSNSLTATLGGMHKQAATLADDVERKQKNLDAFNLQCEDLTGNRSQLFGGKPVQEVENALQAALNSARQKVDESYSRRDKLRNDLTRITAEKEQNENLVKTLRQQRQQLQAQITQWLQQYNETQTEALTEEVLHGLLQFNTVWIEAERHIIRQLDDAVTRAETVLRERQTALNQHQQLRQPLQSEEELSGLINEAKTEQTTQLRQQTIIQVRLRDDAINKKRIGDLLQQIETQTQLVENWAKLNEVIGSADGKKFRQVAQEFTLDVLLGFANVHLDVLNPRYVLQRIPNTLGLQVLDRDMGDEIRTVNSLSGGESFLVSLALALGLASLSSSRMKVESLFIDEGFGSLDPHTLNIAMNALERLHNQGRKVGVISHVQELTERIPVQIRVSKQQSGRSRVEVTGI